MSNASNTLENSRKEDETFDHLHDVLPDHVDRREFFKGAVTAIAGTALAGCLGGGGDGGDGGDGGAGGDGSSAGGDGDSGGDGGQDVLGYPGGETVVFRNSYKDEPYESHSWLAAGTEEPAGFWKEAGIEPPVVKTGQGSGFATQKVGTNSEEFGLASLIPQILGIEKGYTHNILAGMKNQRGILALLYRKDKIPSADPANLEGKTVFTASALDQNTLDIYLDVKGMAPGSMKMKVAEHSSQFALMATGDGGAMWGQLSNIPTLEKALPDGVEIGVDALYQYQPTYGYAMMASQKFLDREGGPEYAKRVIEGLSACGKWIMFNPAKTGEWMAEHVNPALQTRPTEQLANTVKSALIAPNLTKQSKEQGVFYLGKEEMENTFKFVSTAFGMKSTPDFEEHTRYDLLDSAKLAVLSDSEYEEAYDNGQPFSGLFEGKPYNPS